MRGGISNRRLATVVSSLTPPLSTDRVAAVVEGQPLASWRRCWCRLGNWTGAGQSSPTAAQQSEGPDAEPNPDQAGHPGRDQGGIEGGPQGRDRAPGGAGLLLNDRRPARGRHRRQDGHRHQRRADDQPQRLRRYQRQHGREQRRVPRPGRVVPGGQVGLHRPGRQPGRQPAVGLHRQRGQQRHPAGPQRRRRDRRRQQLHHHHRRLLRRPHRQRLLRRHRLGQHQLVPARHADLHRHLAGLQRGRPASTSDPAAASAAATPPSGSRTARASPPPASTPTSSSAPRSSSPSPAGPPPRPRPPRPS